MAKLNDLDRINNLLITYAYSKAEDIVHYGDKMKDTIVQEYPSSKEANKALNISTYVNQVELLCSVLEEIEEMSTKVHRVNKGLDKFE
jgi:hypothetical protein